MVLVLHLHNKSHFHMKKLILLTLTYILLVTPVQSQTYSSLWHQVETAQKADLPQDCLTLLTQIVDKARKDKLYGQLLKAQIEEIAVKTSVSPDSLSPMVVRYASLAQSTPDHALQAVYYATLGHIYKVCSTELGISESSAQKLSHEYYASALADPQMLAKTKARHYEPLVEIGANSTIFSADLLHVIAFEAENYQTMVDYYTHVGNRPAACLASLYMLRSQRTENEEAKKSKYLARVDSLIHDYSDLDVTGEVAIEHFNVMDSSPDISAEEKIEFIDDALVRWQNWPRIVVLKNERSRITLPSYSVTMPETLIIPGREIPVYITSLKNLQTLSMNVYRVNISGNEDYDPNNSEDYKLLLTQRGDRPVATDSRTYYGLPEYRDIRDTLTISPLEVGTYLVEFHTDNSGVATERLLLHVSNLRVVDMDLPDNRMRLIAVDATTGQPISGASISLKFREWRDRRQQEDETTLTTENDGEVVYSSTISPYRYRVSTATDTAFPWQNISRRAWRTPSQDKTTSVIRVFADRSIYRPNQTVQLSVVAYTTYSQEHWETSLHDKVHVELRDSRNNTIAQADLTTDEWGVATTSFTLPETASTGYYSLRASSDSASGACNLRVEEYKRPTFDVTITDYTSRYKAGDTLRIDGVARTFAGIPVANARIEYRVETQFCNWWRVSSQSVAQSLLSDETTTRADGHFTLSVPIEFPSDSKKGNRFARITLTAKVTDSAGETHTAVVSYPLSDKEVAFALSNFEDKQCREDSKPFTIAYLNNAGLEIPSQATIYIDGSNSTTVATNTLVTLPIETLSSGTHTLKVTCQGDTISNSFVVFSLDDTQVPITTDAWYYSTTGGQSRYTLSSNHPEYLQFGTSRENQVIYYAIASDTTLIESGQLTLNNELFKRSFTYKEEWGNGLAIRYSWVRDGKLYSYSESLSRPVRDCQLNVQWKTFRDRLIPGDQEEWTVTITNPDGSPAKAQLMAVLFDASLDQLYHHDWSLSHTPSYFPPTIYQSATYDVSQSYLYGEQSIRYLFEPSLTFSAFKFPDLPTPRSPILFLANTMRTRSVTSTDSAQPMETTMLMAASPEEEDSAPATTESDIALRENLNETAFFLPQLLADKNGNVSLKFTLPESVTTWRFMSIAHDKSMNVGSLQAEVVAQKNLMVQPNIPRFIREGDVAQLSATISNLSSDSLSVTASLVLHEAATEKMVYETSQLCEVAAESTRTITFALPLDLAANLYTCDVIVRTPNLSDGERHALPVLSDEVCVSTTRAFTQTASGDHTINLAELYPEGASHESLTLEYTDNPAFLLLDALPVVATPENDNAISLAVALYANRITQGLTSQLPQNTLPNKDITNIDDIITKLTRLQNSDGSFSWFDGMRPSTYVTHTVARLLARLSHLGLPIEQNMFSRAMSYLDQEMTTYVARLKESEQKTGQKTLPSDLALDYLYVQAISSQTLSQTGLTNAEYLLTCIKDCSAQLTIYGKANVAVVFATHPAMQDVSLAQSLLNSILQYSVSTPEMGRYFDTKKATYSWCDYKIPTQTAAIEAFQTISPSQRETIAQFQQWLLQEKRTQQWDTPINSAAAIYAFFSGPDGFTDGKLSDTLSTDNIAHTHLYVDGKEVDENPRSEGSLLFTETFSGRHNEFRAHKTSSNVSWGAISLSFIQPLEDVVADGEHLSIHREILDANGNSLSALPTIGQLITVRITITAQRDLDFVELTDHRPACLEPSDQLSSYRDGCFVAPGDNKTVYYFDHLSKGSHTINTTYYVDRAGDYLSGIATAQCTYAPEYSAREGAYHFVANK